MDFSASTIAVVYEYWALPLMALVPALAAVLLGARAPHVPGLVAFQIGLASWFVAAEISRLSSSAADVVAPGGLPRMELLAAVLLGALWVGGRQWSEKAGSWKTPVAVTLFAGLGMVAAEPLLAFAPAEALPADLHVPGCIAVLLAIGVGAAVLNDLLRTELLPRSGPRVALATACLGPPLAALAIAWVGGVPAPELGPALYLPLACVLAWLVPPRGPSGANAISEPIIFVDGQGRVVDGNSAAFKLLGLSGRNPRVLHRQVMSIPGLRRLLEDPTRECGEFFTGNNVRERRCFEARVLRTPGQPSGPRVLSIQDVTSRRASERQLFHQAHFDSLTGLANRRYFLDRLEVAVEAAGSSQTNLAVMYIDLDRFKEINDSYGHAAGDELLRTMAHRLRQHLRVGDTVSRPGTSGAASIARLGGDEFALVLEGAGDLEQVEQIATRILALISEPVMLEGKKLWNAGSVGIALFPDHGRDAQTLLRAADVALYHAKVYHRSSFQFFRPELTEETQRKAALDRQLRGAIESNELELHFQPKVSLDGRQLAGAEALLRWRSAELGSVPPKEFVPVAEEFGLIGPIGAWVIDKVCAQMAEWREAKLPVVPVSINVSPQQFTQVDLNHAITDALERHKVSPSWLEIELTESTILEEDSGTAESLRELQAIGVRIALDDFGTGYSSLSYLNRVPLDVLKMDRNFVRDIHLDPGAEGVVSAVISMAHSLNLQVVAEGVDCDEQLDILERMGCDQVQGFVFGPAVPHAEFAEILRSDTVPVRKVERELEPDVSYEVAQHALETDDLPAGIEPALETDDLPAGIEPALETDDLPAVAEPALETDDAPAVAEPELETDEDEPAPAPELDSAAAPVLSQTAAAAEGAPAASEGVAEPRIEAPLELESSPSPAEAAQEQSAAPLADIDSPGESDEGDLDLPVELEEDDLDLSAEVDGDDVDLSAEAAEDDLELPTQVAEFDADLPTQVAEDDAELPTQAAEEDHDLPAQAAEEDHDLPAPFAEEAARPSLDGASEPAKGQADAALASGDEADDEPAPYLLVVDDGQDRLGLLALRMNRIGAAALYARVFDEALLFVAQEGEFIGGLMVPGDAPADEVARLIDRIEGSGGRTPALMLFGAEPSKDLCELSQRCRTWALTEPIDDAMLRHLIRVAPRPSEEAAQRKRPRAPYDVMASLRCEERWEPALLSSLSDRGAFIETSKPLARGDVVGLEFTIEDLVVATTARVLYRNDDEKKGPSGVGVLFTGLAEELECQIRSAVEERAVRCLA